MVDVRVHDTDVGLRGPGRRRAARCTPATSIEMALCAVVTCDGDRITRVEEYVDSAAAAPLLRGGLRRAVITSP